MNDYERLSRFRRFRDIRNDCLFEHPAVDLSEAFYASAWNAWNAWNAENDEK
jgi:hypothetical protein